MSCANCDNDAQENDYLCERCRYEIQPCEHKERQWALGNAPSQEEMRTVLDERTDFEKRLSNITTPFCECCGRADSNLMFDKWCLYCHYYEEYPLGPGNYGDHDFIYHAGEVCQLCLRCRERPAYHKSTKICHDCEYILSLCEDCCLVPALDNNTRCRDCNFWHCGVNEGAVIIYHGDNYRGNILACKVVSMDIDGALKLALPPSFTKKEMFVTDEVPNCCVRCGATFINHWPPDRHYPLECAPCAGVQVFPWAARILEWS